MSRTRITAFVSAVLALGFLAAPVLAQDASRAAENGGIHVSGWMGKIDAREAENGMTLENASLVSEGDGLHVTTGPAVAYWNESNTASGDYTVTATFHEAEYMSLNNHPHPYGLFIGGSGMGTESQSYLYCAAYGSGAFIVRGFGPEAFQMNGRRPEAHDAVNQAAGQGEPVIQEISMSVHGGMVECAINGTTVASYPVGDVVADGRLQSTDGIYGVRFGHNTEAVVTGLSVQSH
ncbi:MAG: hypothetical protein HKO53_06235 [Gemmatimonadetes bacterium]|nr:hypothetical protein [Gemmatimonadota bacterium]